MYDLGQGVPQDYAEAANWFLEAAEQGDVYSQQRLGHMFYTGEGIARDYIEAAKWTRKAAEQGDAMSQGLLGGMYAFGRGVPQDYVLGHMWFNLGATRGDESLSEFRDTLARSMSQAQIAEAQKLAREWRPK